ncbi:MAG: S1 RNA-binding domain-containing protein [Oscillospiraceae bacterium]|nr:S1 RNA-binding domain-containing protein [Oscillospiraceae bacterium]
MKKYYPEGMLYDTEDNKSTIKDINCLMEAIDTGKIIEAYAMICDNDHNLIVDLPCIRGVIPRLEGAVGIEDGSTRDIALISRVSKPVCFKVLRIDTDKYGRQTAVLSRKAAQEECLIKYLGKLSCGDIIPARITHIEQFGCFVDIGCGIPSMIPIDAISISRISHPRDRFHVMQDVRAVVKSIDNDSDHLRINLSHKELLGTWEENASMFKAGETVAGIVRSVENYGIFIELTPNLAGLAEPKENVKVGQHASVYIKALIPEKMKVKLIIVDVFDDIPRNTDIKYFITGNHIDNWKYTTDSAEKIIESTFTDC